MIDVIFYKPVVGAIVGHSKAKLVRQIHSDASQQIRGIEHSSASKYCPLALQTEHFTLKAVEIT